jgi:pimeloyl-ACP methyl ester carboxylesterase
MRSTAGLFDPSAVEKEKTNHMKTTQGVVSRYSSVILFCLAAWLGQLQVFAFSIGDRVQANGTVNVRATAAGTLLGTQSSGSQGAVIGGPTVATLNGTSYTWYNINFDSGTDGWVADIGLISAPPTVQTVAASSVTVSSAQLNATVYPNGSSTTVYFQYGTTASYGSTTTAGSIGTQNLNLGTTVSGLSPSTTYHFRIVAYNSTGTSYGSDLTFTTSAQPAPTVSTVAASSITVNSAQLNATVNANGANTTVYFQYGTTASYGSTTTSGSIGTQNLNLGTTVSGLSPSTTYHFRIVAYNSGGTSYGSDLTFTTSAQPAPIVQTLAASLVTNTSAQLNATVNANGADTTVYFQYGTTASYGSTTTSGSIGTQNLNLGTVISGLAPSTTYHFRIVAYNSGGTSYGSDATFSTTATVQPGPIVQTLSASSITASSAQLNATVNANGANTTVYFQYGTTASYGSTTTSGSIGTQNLNLGTTISGLAANTTYHFRIVAFNSNGTSYGSDVSFTTSSTSSGPTVQTLAASTITPTSAQLNGYLSPNGLNTTAYFQYGTTTGYGSTTPSGNFGTTPQNIGYNVSGLLPSTTYHYRIVAFNSSGTSYGLDSSFVTPAASGSTPPTVVTQPQSQTVQAGVNVTFTVGVSGSTPLSYQWLRNGAVMSGKTSASLMLPSVGTFDSDGYSVVVTNSFGKVTSATAWLAVYPAPTNSAPATPVVVQTNRPPENPNLIPVTGTQLKVFSNGVFVTGGTIDLNKMTVVFTHGWNSNPDVWAKSMASNMVAGTVANANFVAWDWRTNAAAVDPFRPSSRTPAEGRLLGQTLATVLGSSYGKPIHFIGHSLGTLVNATAANYLHEMTGGAFDWQKTHMTLLDDAEIAEVGGAFIRVGETIPGLESLFGQSETPTVGWVSPIPNHSSWIDSYMSLVGWPRTTTVNVWLNQGIDRADKSNPIQFLQDAHGYVCKWYGDTAFQPTISILGNRYSFERLGFNTQPGQACPYPAASLFVQDTYPLGQYALHEPSLLEFDLMVIRHLAMFTTYSRLSAVNALNGIGQKTGDSYVDVQVSAAPTVSSTTSGIISDFFYSLRTVLNSSSSSQSQLALRNGPTALDAGAGTESPCVWLPIVVPTNAVVLSFDFTFTGSPGSDVLSANIDGTNVFALEAEFIPQNQKLNSGSIPVVNWAGKPITLFLGLVGGSSSNATVTIDAMRFYELAAPSLAITTYSNQVVISWPLSAQGFTLESASTLTGSNQWSVVATTPTTNGLSLQLTNPVSGNAKFYRLKK